MLYLSMDKKDSYQCILHTKCGGGVVAPNLGVLTGDELLAQTLDLIDYGVRCFKCGEEVKADELEIEKV